MVACSVLMAEDSSWSKRYFCDRNTLDLYRDVGHWEDWEGMVSEVLFSDDLCLAQVTFQWQAQSLLGQKAMVPDYWPTVYEIRSSNLLVVASVESASTPLDMYLVAVEISARYLMCNSCNGWIGSML